MLVGWLRVCVCPPLPSTFITLTHTTHNATTNKKTQKLARRPGRRPVWRGVPPHGRARRGLAGRRLHARRAQHRQHELVGIDARLRPVRLARPVRCCVLCFFGFHERSLMMMACLPFFPSFITLPPKKTQQKTNQKTHKKITQTKLRPRLHAQPLGRRRALHLLGAARHLPLEPRTFGRGVGAAGAGRVAGAPRARRQLRCRI